MNPCLKYQRERERESPFNLTLEVTVGLIECPLKTAINIS